MRNPLNKRLPRELKSNFGKYIVIFLFLVLLISLVSGFLVAGDSMSKTYDEGLGKNRVEHGHFTTSEALEEDTKKEIEEKANVTLYNLYYIDAKNDKDKHVRIYAMRNDVNKASIMEGEFPKEKNEIAIDRLFASKNNYKIGDVIHINQKDLKITGTVALSDYSCLFEDNSEMMFNAKNFTVALMSDKGFADMGNSHVEYNYAWMYQESFDMKNDKANKEHADDLMEILGDVLIDYNTTHFDPAKNQEALTITDFVPRYQNQAINFARDDIGGDKAMFVMFGYIVTLVIAFIFAVTISNTIEAEASVIGTLRASGYKKSELICHYMAMPIIVTLFGALIGNILGYSVMKNVMADMYYNSYSLSRYKTIWNVDAFVQTTVIPIIMMFVVNLFVLNRKLRLSPIQFLRKTLTTKKEHNRVYLSSRLPFLLRFRLRVIFQNVPNYIVLFLGMMLGGTIIIFGLMYGPLLSDYKELVLEQRLSDYQYMVMNTDVKTENEQAEKFAMTSIKIQCKDYVEDDVSIYGIDKDSRYVDADLSDEKVVASSAYMKKYGLQEGDEIELFDSYTEKNYKFKISGFYDYDGAIAIFMNLDYFNTTFDKDKDYFTGYFSNEKLTDIAEDDIARIVTLKDITKLSDQLTDSIGGFMDLVKYFGIIMFLLLMYLLSKQIIEKNVQSISMVKILGFKNTEIGSIYIVATSFVVVAGLLIICPIISLVLKYVFTQYLYKEMTGYIPYIVSNTCYIYMILIGILCYACIAIFQMFKISRVSKADALKNVE